MIYRNSLTWTQVYVFLPLVIFCERYSYLLFENSDLTTESFIREQQMVRRLKVRRLTMHKEFSELLTSMKTEPEVKKENSTLKADYQHKSLKTIDFELRKIYDYMLNTKRAYLINRDHDMPNTQYKHDKEYTFDFTYSMSAKEIMRGAINGVIMLQETYMQDIKEYYKGNLHLKNNIKPQSRQIDSLLSQDLATMSKMAFTFMNWCDNGLQYLKLSLDLFHSLSIEDRNKLPIQFERTIFEMKNTYPLLHNDLLMKRKKHLGYDWKLFPQMIDKG